MEKKQEFQLKYIISRLDWFINSWNLLAKSYEQFVIIWKPKHNIEIHFYKLDSALFSEVHEIIEIQCNNDLSLNII